jgi:hypothetical protein
VSGDTGEGASAPEAAAAPPPEQATPGAKPEDKLAPPAPGKLNGSAASLHGAASEEAAEDQLGEKLASAVSGWSSGTSITVNGSINMASGTIGTSAGWSQPGGGTRLARTGRIADEEIVDLCGHFEAPPQYWEAVEALEHDRVVGLTGVAGIGKRTSALGMLRAASADPLEVVSPTVTLMKLTEYDFEAGHGYLVEDWQDARGADAASDFTWRLLSDHVKDREAYLVITASAAKAPRSVKVIAWKAPSARRVLASYVTGTSAESVIDEVAEKLPDTDAYEIGQIAAIGRRLADGADLPAILTELSEDPARYTRQWLSADDRTERDFLEVTTLAFAAGQSQRIYDIMLKRLQITLQEAGLLPDPEKEGTGKDKEADGARAAPRSGLLDARIHRRHADGLLDRELLTEGGVSWEVVGFRKEASQRHALEALWRDFDIAFWIAVREWLSELIGDTMVTLDRDAAIQVSVARGMALLAPVALAEIYESYLQPWAAGERGWPGQQTAMYVLWWMSLDGALAPIALRIATSWADSGDPECQWTAAFALSGQLGAVYPVDAARRLWHLIGQWKDIPVHAIVALANLFATLAGQEGTDAYPVLELLRERMHPATSRRDQSEVGDEPRRPSASWRDDRRNRERALLSVLAVLACRDPRTKQPVVTTLVQARPDYLPLVAELWGEVLCSRPHRRRALVALLDAVRGFKYVSDEPEEAARALGDALSEALPPVEHPPLITDFANIHKHSKRSRAETAATVEALLKAIEHLKPS